MRVCAADIEIFIEIQEIVPRIAMAKILTIPPKMKFERYAAVFMVRFTHLVLRPVKPQMLADSASMIALSSKAAMDEQTHCVKEVTGDGGT